jgi:Flp pilus assembly protein CpaB
VTGGFAVAAAVVIVFAAYVGSSPGRGRPWVVAAAALPAGTRLTTADLTTTTLRLGTGPTSTDAFGSPAPLVGRTLAVAVDPGELILGGELQAVGTVPTLRPVPVTVPPADLVDLGPNDLVDILATTGDTTSTRTAVVVRGARVESTAQPSGGDLGSGDDVVTVGVGTLAEVEAVVAAEHAGTVDLVVGVPGDGSGPG